MKMKVVATQQDHNFKLGVEPSLTEKDIIYKMKNCLPKNYI